MRDQWDGLLIAILNMEIREGFPEEVMFEQDQKKVKEQVSSFLMCRRNSKGQCVLVTIFKIYIFY